MRHITIHECFESLDITNRINEKSINQIEADELERYIKKEGLDQENIIWGRNTITFINYVGFIKLSSVSIEILPKININSNNPEEERKALLNMLVKCGIIKVNYSEINLLHLYKMNLNEILSYIFAHKLQKELTKGTYFEYVYVKDNINSLKGSLVINNQIKNIAFNIPKAFCRYEEFSIDNDLNQILTYCIKKLVKNIKNQETIKLLRHCKAYLSEVSEREVNNNELIDYKFNRLNSRYEEVFILAKSILMGYSSLGSKGDEKCFSILFKMNEVFEKYITRMLSSNLKNVIVYSQHSKYKLLVNEKKNTGVFQLKPDIVIAKCGIESIIIDTKWKSISSLYNRHGVKREDLYQMYAYLTRYPNVETVVLLYPYNDRVDNHNECLESWVLEHDRNKKIKVYSVNLENEKSTIKSLKNIIKDININSKVYL